MSKLNILLVAFFSLFLYERYYTGTFHKTYIDYQLTQHEEVVVMYGAEWCPGCKQVQPILEKLEEFGYIKLIHVDIDTGDYRFYGMLPTYIPQITVYRRYPAASGIVYHGQFPNTLREFLTLFMGNELSDSKREELFLFAKTVYGDDK